MDELRQRLSSEVRKRQISYDTTYMCNVRKMIQRKLFTKQKQTHKHREQTYGYQEESMGEGIT